MAYVVYVLLSLKDGRRYVGVTSDLDRRLKEHDQGWVKSTRGRRPLRLIYSEEWIDKRTAWRRERFLKSGRGRELLNSYSLEP